jgi:hypothetical protein
VGGVGVHLGYNGAAALVEDRGRRRVEVQMTPLSDTTPLEPDSTFDPIHAPRFADVPGLMADRVGSLWAAEELRERSERTDRLIKQAQGLRD